jgi:ribosomal protein L2
MSKSLQKAGKSVRVTRRSAEKEIFVERERSGTRRQVRSVCRRVAGREARKSARSATLFDAGRRVQLLA